MILNHCLSMLKKNIENKIELKELADFMGYGPFYISRKFVDIYGIPIIGYVRIRKLPIKSSWMFCFMLLQMPCAVTKIRSCRKR